MTLSRDEMLNNLGTMIAKLLVKEDTLKASVHWCDERFSGEELPGPVKDQLADLYTHAKKGIQEIRSVIDSCDWLVSMLSEHGVPSEFTKQIEDMFLQCRKEAGKWECRVS